MSRPTSRDQGSAGVEAAIAVTSLMMVGFFIIGALRVTNTGGDVDAVARSATRAAAAEYDDASAYRLLKRSPPASWQTVEWPVSSSTFSSAGRSPLEA